MSNLLLATLLKVKLDYSTVHFYSTEQKLSNYASRYEWFACESIVSFMEASDILFYGENNKVMITVRKTRIDLLKLP